MIKLKNLIQEKVYDPEFVGFHRQKRTRSKYDDMFITGNNYGKMYFREILDSLFNKDRDEAMKMRWLDFDWNDKYSDEYDEMEKTVSHWLNEKGYRWIFVTENRPIGITAYGNYIYKVYFNKEDILHFFPDPYGADDVAYAYVYHIKNPPKFEEYND